MSFRPEDENKLAAEDYKKIEGEFAKALGFTEHQRICAIHKNTNNLHMHIAYNMIHPQTLTKHNPFYDYHKRDRVCRELEKLYSVQADNGIEIKRHTIKGDKPRNNYEAHTGQESFQSYVKRQKNYIIRVLDRSNSWQQFHDELAKVGLEVALRGNGYVVRNIVGKEAVKASYLGREYSKSALEKQLEIFQKSTSRDKPKPTERYTRRPLGRIPKQEKFYKEYQEAMSARRKQLGRIYTERAESLKACRHKWKVEAQRVRIDPTLRWSEKKGVLAAIKDRKRRDERLIREKAVALRKNVDELMPYRNWKQFVKHGVNSEKKVITR